MDSPLGYSLFVRGLVVLSALGWVSCFSPRLPAIACVEGACPDGLVCNDRQQCVQRGQNIDAAATDSPLDVPSSDASPLGLVDIGLLGRWFIDEAADGTAITALTNAVTGGVDLGIDYTATTFVEKNGHRGLAIGAAGGGGGPIQSIGGTALEEGLEQTQRFTIELVCEFNINSLPMFINIVGDGQEPLEFIITGQLDARLRATGGEARWNFNLPTRSVVHLVFDSRVVEVAELYIDGVLVAPTSSGFPANGAVAFGGDPILGLGNAYTTGRPLDGIMYYAAIYNRALTPAAVAVNSAILLERDDR